jgi:acyl-CoA hydrolase
VPDRIPAIKVPLLPKDTNARGTIFGGVILLHIDLASAVEARKTGVGRRPGQLFHRDGAGDRLTPIRRR